VEHGPGNGDSTCSGRRTAYIVLFLDELLDRGRGGADGMCPRKGKRCSPGHRRCVWRGATARTCPGVGGARISRGRRKPTQRVWLGAHPSCDRQLGLAPRRAAALKRLGADPPAQAARTRASSPHGQPWPHPRSRTRSRRISAVMVPSALGSPFVRPVMVPPPASSFKNHIVNSNLQCARAHACMTRQMTPPGHGFDLVLVPATNKTPRAYPAIWSWT